MYILPRIKIGNRFDLDQSFKICNIIYPHFKKRIRRNYRKHQQTHIEEITENRILDKLRIYIHTNPQNQKNQPQNNTKNIQIKSEI
jgi:hypothetical protein